MSQSVSAKRRLRSTRSAAQACASRSASISACVRQRISATDDHLQVVAPKTLPRLQFLGIARPWSDGPQECDTQLPIHPPDREHGTGIEHTNYVRRLAIGEGREVEAVGDTIDRRRDALAVSGTGERHSHPLRYVCNAAGYYPLPNRHG